MKIKISDKDHVFIYNSESGSADITQHKPSKNYCKIWGFKKFVNPITKNIKYLLESEENVPMYGDTTIHKLAEFVVKDKELVVDNIYVEENLDVDIEKNVD